VGATTAGDRGSAAVKRRAARASRAARAEPPAKRTARNGSAASRVYHKLLADILHGRQRPGTRVRLLPLANTYGTSSTTLREVLIRLSGDELVVRSSEHGFTIAPASTDELLDLVKILGWIEAIGVRESIAHGDRHWEEDVLATHRALGQQGVPPGAGRERDIAHWGELVLDFHRAIVSACRSPILTEQCGRLQQRLLRYRNLAERPAYAGEAERGYALEIRNALLARAGDEACRALQSYYRHATATVLASGALR
jgi:DNA-binding GntR family transcriptional regulator